MLAQDRQLESRSRRWSSEPMNAGTSFPPSLSFSGRQLLLTHVLRRQPRTRSADSSLRRRPFTRRHFLPPDDMNSYFEHSTAGFYSPAHHPAVADPHTSAYRSFPHSLSLMSSTPQSAYQPASRTNSSSTASDSSSNYVESACKLYDPNPLSSSQPPSASVFKGECGLSKEQNGFKPPDQMSGWNSTPSLRPSPATGSGFDVNSRSVSDPWSACCQNPPASFVDPYSSLRPFDGGDYHHHHHHRYTSNGSSTNGKTGTTDPTFRHVSRTTSTERGMREAAAALLSLLRLFQEKRQKGTRVA